MHSMNLTGSYPGPKNIGTKSFATAIIPNIHPQLTIKIQSNESEIL